MYGKAAKGKNQEKPKASKILTDLETVFSEPKQEWSISVLRKLLDTLLKNQGSRGRSAAHEAAWYNLCGFLFRPGYGHSLDSHRINDLWNLFYQGVKHNDATQVKNEWWVLWRRVAGGLKRSQQNKIFDKVFPQLRNQKASAEMIMTLGALEGLDATKKVMLGNYLVGMLQIGDSGLYLEQRFWTLTRVACRFPVVSGPENILRPFCGEVV